MTQPNKCPVYGWDIPSEDHAWLAADVLHSYFINSPAFNTPMPDGAIENTFSLIRKFGKLKAYTLALVNLEDTDDQVDAVRVALIRQKQDSK